MQRNAFKTKGEGVHFGKVISAGGMSLLLLMGQTAPLLGNPTGGTVVAGAASIGAAGATLSINQATRNAIINWQQFSIAGGETTKFLVPNSGATLNRVTGGNLSAIYGNLQSNGALYLINPSGIVVGPSGRINTESFLASTLDISNEQFLAGGNLEFAGTSGASVENDGVIHASTGDVYLIANQVTNKGTLSATKGTVGLAAGSDILFQQAGSQHLFVQATPAGTKRAVGVTNAGTIRAAAAELKAAGGNAYALAINNTGVIAATGYKKINGQVYLTSDGGSISNSGKISAKQANGNGGTIVVDGTATTSTTSGTVTNSGTLDASATVAGGKGGTVSLKNIGGKTDFTGTILAKGGQGGAGGNAEVSGAVLIFTGLVNLTAPGGTTGTLLLDPTTLDVINGGTGTIVSGENDSTSTTISPTTIQDNLATANVTLNADMSITITSGIMWNSTSTLTLSTNDAGSTIAINASISGASGGLTIDAAESTDAITTTAAGTVNVASFILQNGSWTQNGSLPAFTASHDFEIQGDSSFLRVAGGDGSDSPYQIADVYGLEGLGSPSGIYLNSNAEMIANINASGTATWNGGEGFIPIGGVDDNYTATFDGQNLTINGIVANQPNAQYIGVFGELSAGALVENLNVTNEQISGDFETGGIVGGIYGTVNNSTTSGTVNGGSEGSFIGGIVGGSSGNVTSSSSSDTVSGNNAIGGLVGANGGGTINLSSTSGTVSGVSDVGGLVGADNGGIVENSSSTATVNGSESVGGLIGDNNGGTVSNSNGNGSVNGNGNSSNGSSPVTPTTGTTTSSSTPSTTTGGAADGGSNIVPPALTPQPVQVTQPDNPVITTSAAAANGGTQAPPLSFTGTGISNVLGEQVGGLASSSGNSGQVTSGDTAQMSGGQLNNTSNPQAAGTLEEALGPIVYSNLSDALKVLGDWADVPDSAGGNTASDGGGSETILTEGGVAEMGSTGVKSIPLSQAPAQLQNALNADGLQGMGSGH